MDANLASDPARKRIYHGQLLLRFQCAGEYTLGQLTLEIGEDAESLSVSIMIKLRVIATLHLVRVALINPVTGLVPKPRVGARRIVCVADFKVEVSSVALPYNLMLGKIKRRGCVEEPIESNKVT